MILPFWIYKVYNPIFGAMADSFMAVLTDWENINPISVS
jgi:hypothetical protein